MLAVFSPTVAKSPDGLRQPDPSASPAAGAAAIAQHFAAEREGAVILSFGASGSIVYSPEKQNPLVPRLFAAVDDIFCLFEGHVGDIPLLKQQYGLSKNATEVTIIIEAYRTLRDRGPYPADQIIRDLKGKFAFILFDGTTNSTFIAADADGNVPFFWGTDSEEKLVLSNDMDTVKKACGKSFAPFPKGCFFTTSGGLKSYEHPLNELKVMPRVDSKGEVYGATYKVDAESKRGTGIPRVGSETDWSSHY